VAKKFKDHILELEILVNAAEEDFGKEFWNNYENYVKKFNSLLTGFQELGFSREEELVKFVPDMKKAYQGIGYSSEERAKLREVLNRAKSLLVTLEGRKNKNIYAMGWQKINEHPIWWLIAGACAFFLAGYRTGVWYTSLAYEIRLGNTSAESIMNSQHGSKSEKKILSKDSTALVKQAPIVILPRPYPEATRWHLGGKDGSQTMQVIGEFIVTNNTDKNILLTSARIRHPSCNGFAYVKDVNSSCTGSYPIPPGSTTNMSLEFWISPAFKRKGEKFKSDISVIDQFAKEHLIRDVEFIFQ
jgi:hypothetical protein